jgi:hypothetical protein
MNCRLAVRKNRQFLFRRPPQMACVSPATGCKFLTMTTSLISSQRRIWFMPRKHRLLALVGAALAMCFLLAGPASAASGKEKKAKATPQKCVCAKKTKKPAKTKAQKTQYVEVTGSLIKRPVGKNGQPIITESDLVIIGRDQIQLSGASTLSGVLNKTGVTH